MDSAKFAGYKMIVCAIFIVAGGVGFTYYSLSLYLPSWIEAFDCSLGEGSIAFSIIGLTTMLGSFASSMIVGRIGLKRLFIFGLDALLAGYGLLYIAQSLLFLYVAGSFIGLGIGWVGMIPLGTIAPNWFIEKQGAMVGIVAASMGIDGFVANLLFSNVIASFGWRASVLLTMAIVVVLCVPALVILKPTPQEIGQQPLGYVPGTVSEDEAADSNAEYKAAQKTSSFWLLCLLVLSISCLITGMVPQVASIVTFNGFDLVFAGTVSSIMQIANVFGSFAMGIINDKFKSRGALTYALTIGSVSMAAVFFTESAVGCIVFAVLFGFAQSLLTTLYPLLINPVFGSGAANQIVSFFNGISGVGEALMPSVVGFVVTLTGTYNIAAAMQIAIICFGVACGFAALKKAPKKKQEKE